MIWLHGASVGEVRAAGILLEGLTRALPLANLVVTTVTEQGLRVAQKSLGDRATCLLAPLDLPGAVDRTIRSIEPDIYLCLETELWPNTLAGLRKNGTSCFLLNARLSNKSLTRYRWFGGFARQVLRGFSGIAAITAADAERLITLGADPKKVTVCGNLKYDLPPLSDPESIRRGWRQILGLASDTPVLVAGSTHSGEEMLLLEVFISLKPVLPALVLILAPRHLQRLGTIQAELAAAGARYDLLSQIHKGGRGHDVVLIDTMGELPTLYSVATYTFCGGSLVERGGHNIMEAARWGHPVFYGPSMKDFTDARELLESGGGGFLVNNAMELAESITQLAGYPELYKRAAEAAKTCASGQNGAVDRQLGPVLTLLRQLAAQKNYPPEAKPVQP